MSLLFFRTASALALCAATAGCVTAPPEPTTQQLEIHTILDHREVTGVGCVLSNAAGRWFVVAPGRVTVERSRSPLTIDCAREGAGSALEVARAQNTSLFDTGRLVGSIVARVGGSRKDPYGSSGVVYESTLTVLMEPPTPPEAQRDPGNAVF